jgi:hypothetical protein
MIVLRAERPNIDPVLQLRQRLKRARRDGPFIPKEDGVWDELGNDDVRKARVRRPA